MNKEVFVITRCYKSVEELLCVADTLEVADAGAMRYVSDHDGARLQVVRDTDQYRYDFYVESASGAWVNHVIYVDKIPFVEKV